MFPRGKHEPFARLWSLTVLCFVGMNGEITVKDRILSVENPVFLVKNSSEIKISHQCTVPRSVQMVTLLFYSSFRKAKDKKKVCTRIVK